MADISTLDLGDVLEASSQAQKQRKEERIALEAEVAEANRLRSIAEGEKSAALEAAAEAKAMLAAAEDTIGALRSQIATREAELAAQAADNAADVAELQNLIAAALAGEEVELPALAVNEAMPGGFVCSSARDGHFRAEKRDGGTQIEVSSNTAEGLYEAVASWLRTQASRKGAAPVTPIAAAGDLDTVGA